jgi:hypothetical protein
MATRFSPAKLSFGVPIFKVISPVHSFWAQMVREYPMSTTRLSFRIQARIWL